MVALRNHRRRCSGFLLASASALISTIATASEPLLQQHNIVGTMSCTAAACHGGSGPGYWSGSAKGAEFVHWLGTSPTYSGGRRDYDPRARLVRPDGDPHALAAQRMLEPRFQEVLRRASARADGSIDAEMLTQCAKCHDPHRTPHTPPHESLTQNAISAIGISCETCHGNAQLWLALHYQTGVTRSELSRMGMIDTKDLQVRAKLCASCHVGSKENDMNHDMIAAGHPPLRFEQASYEALLGKKHWNDAPARLADGNYEVKLWATGRIAATKAALELLEGRSQRAGVSDGGPWPELAESNCLSCHQPLRREGTQKVELGLLANRTAVLPWQSWNTALLKNTLPESKPTINDLPSPDGDCLAALQRLRVAMEQSALPDAHQVATLSTEAKSSLQRRLGDGQLAITALSVLESFDEIDRQASWDELCQRVAALAAVRRSLEDQGKLSATMADEAKQRLESLAAALRFTRAGREWPVIFSDHSPLSRAEVTHQISRLQDDLLREARR